MKKKFFSKFLIVMHYTGMCIFCLWRPRYRGGIGCLSCLYHDVPDTDFGRKRLELISETIKWKVVK